MKPSEIVFFKKYINSSKYCTKNELKSTKVITILGKDWYTEPIVESFIIKKYYEFDTMHNKRSGLDWAKFIIVGQTDDSLKVDVYFSDKDKIYATIEFLKGENLKVHNKSCKGGIVSNILDLDDPNTFKRKSVDSFSFAVGLYLLARLDGDWDKPLRDYSEEINDSSVDISELISTLQEYENTIKERETQLQELNVRYNIAIKNLEDQVIEYDKQIAALKLILDNH